MENSIASYPESESTIKVLHTTTLSSRFQTVANLGERNSNEFISFTIDKKQIGNLFEKFHFRNHLNVLRNDYYVVAIRNLLKKNEFLQLSLQLSEKLVSEEEFDLEIEKNPDKYIIQMKNLEHPIQLHVISNVINKIGKSFTTDEVSELFSIDSRSIDSELKTIGIKP